MSEIDFYDVIPSWGLASEMEERCLWEPSDSLSIVPPADFRRSLVDPIGDPVNAGIPDRLFPRSQSW